jgi:16S rRNA (cytosine967-C5)-methyltransferase
MVEQASDAERDAESPSELRLRTVPWAELEGLTDAVLGAARAVLGGGAADGAVDRMLRKNRGWSAGQRQATVEAIFGIGLWRRRLAWHAGVEGASPENASTLLAVLLRDLGGMEGSLAAQLSGLPPEQLPRPKPAPEDLGIRWSVPEWLVAELTRSLGQEAPALAQALNLPGPVCVRANLGLCSREELRGRLAEEHVASAPTRFSPLGLTLSGRANILGLRAHQAGLFEVQDEGSQLLGLLLEARRGETVLDLCAGAGGKTLLLADQVGPSGVVYAYDVQPEPLERLRVRAARARLTNVRILTKVPSALEVDRVLVDAPCSSLGALRRGPDVRFRIDPASLAGHASVQRELLAQAARYVRPGGRLLYATCTLRQEENEQVVEAFLQANEAFGLAALDAPWLRPDMVRQGSFHCLPHLHGTDGFFAAAFERRHTGTP